MRAIICCLVLGALAMPANANLVVNGDFESMTHGPNAMLNQLTSELTTWSVAGIDAVYGTGGADTVGAASYQPGHVYLWGPGNGVSNGLTAASPTGGNFLAADGDIQYAGTITQTVTGLTIGQSYTMSFYYAAAQWRNEAGTFWNGPSTEAWRVTLGSETHTTGVLAIPSHGFSGWQSASFNYTATAASELLTFFAVGTPTGSPPVALLDGISLTPTVPGGVPEPASWALMMMGFALTGIAVRRRTVPVAT